MKRRDPRVRLQPRDVLLALAVPAIAVAVAAVAVYRYHDAQQSSWRGIGFGMFATYEQEQSRFIRVEATVDGETTVVAIPDDLARVRERAEVMPFDRATRELAEEMLARTGADRIDLEVRGHVVHADPDRLVVSVRVIREVTVP